MTRAIKLSDELVQQASERAKTMSRSTADQIEYWAKIGKIAEDNPDLSYRFIQDILIGLEEIQSGQAKKYIFGEGKNHHVSNRIGNP